MPQDEPPSQCWELGVDTDLLAALDTRRLEHLDVDEYRTFVLYREAVLDLRVTEGSLVAARAGTVTSQGFAWHVSNPDPKAIITEFYQELVTATDRNYRDTSPEEHN